MNEFLLLDYNYFDEDFYSNDYDDDTTTIDEANHVVTSLKTVWKLINLFGTKFRPKLSLENAFLLTGLTSLILIILMLLISVVKLNKVYKTQSWSLLTDNEIVGEPVQDGKEKNLDSTSLEI